MSDKLIAKCLEWHEGREWLPVACEHCGMPLQYLPVRRLGPGALREWRELPRFDSCLGPVMILMLITVLGGVIAFIGTTSYLLPRTSAGYAGAAGMFGAFLVVYAGVAGVHGILNHRSDLVTQAYREFLFRLGIAEPAQVSIRTEGEELFAIPNVHWSPPQDRMALS
jgi:hypothetical protein